MGDVRLSADPLDASAAMASVAHPSYPAAALFVGTVRDDSATRRVVSLEYEAFTELAEAEMRAICDEVAERHGARCALVHRTGVVRVGEPSVIAAVCAVSYRVAMTACEYVVDELKARVPVWKLQTFADGGAEWAEGA